MIASARLCRFADSASAQNAPDKFVAPFRNSNGKFGYVNENHCWVIDPVYDFALVFSDDLAGIQIDNKWGFIDKLGQIIVQPKFDSIGIFSEGLASVQIDKEWGYIDKKGQFVLHSSNNLPGEFRRSYSYLIQKSGFYYGQQMAGNFKEGLTNILSGNKFGLIDTKGNIIINTQFDDIRDYSEGLAAVKFGQKWGFINHEGKFVINPLFTSVESFHKGTSLVSETYKSYFIDRDGKIVSKKYFAVVDYSEDLVPVSFSGKWGFMDRNEKLLLMENLMKF